MDRDETQAIEALTARLCQRFADQEDDVIRGLVVAAHRGFDDARMREFVPLLVEHEVVRQLMARERFGSVTW